MFSERKIPDSETSSTSKMIAKFYESVICPITRRGKEVYKWSLAGAVIGGSLVEGISAASMGFKHIHVKNSETCNYEEKYAESYNCSFNLNDHPITTCRNLINPKDGDYYFPLTCVNDTNNIRRSALVAEASNWGDNYANDWYLGKAPEVALWSGVAGIAVGGVVGGIYGFFKELPLQSNVENDDSESLLQYNPNLRKK